MASGYVHKKSVGRNKALNPDVVTKDTNIPSTPEVNHLDEFIQNKTMTKSVGEMLNHVEAFKGQNLIDDVADVKVKPITAKNYLIFFQIFLKA